MDRFLQQLMTVALRNSGCLNALGQLDIALRYTIAVDDPQRFLRMSLYDLELNRIHHPSVVLSHGSVPH